MVLLAAVIIGLAAQARAQEVMGGLPLPPGDIITGPIYRRNGTFIPEIMTGADANAYIFSVPPTASFLDSGAAFVVRTTEPTQYIRFYTNGVTSPIGSFIVGSNVIRGKSAAQIRDLLALPYMPDSLVIVEVPAGTCMLIGTAGPILGHFPANPPAIPTPGPWGRGGVTQERLIGLSSAPGCANAKFVPADDYVNLQPIGLHALSYRPRAGGGNVGTVATALDTATPPPLFSDMDSVYNALDLLNYGSPGPLQSALMQLDGEAYADFSTVEIAGADMFLQTLRNQMWLGRTEGNAALNGGVGEAELGIGSNTLPAGDGRLRAWIAGFGGGGNLAGDGDSHDVAYDVWGGAVGADYRVSRDLLAGAALSYSGGGFGVQGISGNGAVSTFSFGAYASYAPGNWYLDGALGYAHSWGDLSRSIVFPGLVRSASATPGANEFLSSLETGYHIRVDENMALTPFAAMQGIVIRQNAFTESGAGAIDLQVADETTASARSLLGLEFTGDLPVGLAQPLGLQLRAGWSHDFADPARSVTASFVGAPDASFTVQGASPDRDAAVIGVGLSLPVMPSGELFLRYDGAFAGNFSVNAGTVGFHLAF
jgi:outer membrane autotransporter protein